MGARRWKRLGVIRATPPPPLDSRPVSGYGQALRGNDEFRGTGVAAWHGEFAPRILRRPTPTPAGDKPLASRSLRPRYIFSFRHRPWVHNSAGFAGGEPALRLNGGHIPDRSPGHAFGPIAHAGWRWSRWPRSLWQSTCQLGMSVITFCLNAVSSFLRLSWPLHPRVNVGFFSQLLMAV